MWVGTVQTCSIGGEMPQLVAYTGSQIHSARSLRPNNELTVEFVS
jgi:hypothetical protein